MILTRSDIFRLSPSVYAILYSVTVNYNCTTSIHPFEAFTAAFAPGQISTLDPFVTGWNAKPYDFNDMPCGPPGVDLNGQPYRPSFAPPPLLFSKLSEAGLDVEGCHFMPFSDPLSAIQTAGAVNGPQITPREGPVQVKKAAATADVAPQAAVKTPAP